MYTLPTVAIHHPSDPDVMMTINESDLTSAHVPWGHFAESEDGEIGDMRVGKGPRGKWYVKLGKENIEGPFETEGEAQAALTSAGAE